MKECACEESMAKHMLTKVSVVTSVCLVYNFINSFIILNIGLAILRYLLLLATLNRKVLRD